MGKEKKEKRDFKYEDENHLDLVGVLYVIENTLTGEKYVGVTTRSFKHRMSQHINLHSKKKSSATGNRTVFYDDLNEHGPEIFIAKVIEQSNDIVYLREKEDEIRVEPEFHRYGSKDVDRDFSRKREYTKIVCTSICGTERLEFKSQAECGRHFNCGRTNVTRALRGEYNLRKKYIVTSE
jgi:hypothetical protein